MIIKVPTGLYSELLPKKPSDAGSVTFTVSNQTPTRSELIYPKIPQQIIERPKYIRSKDILKRRNTMGDLVVSINNSKTKQLGNNNKIYEIGQVLSFGETTLKSLDPMLVNDKNEVKHNINKLDYARMNVNSDEASIIQTKSLLIYEKLVKELNNIKTNRRDYEIIIQSNQKIINDTNRTINALNIILEQEKDDDIIGLKNKLEDKILASENIIAEAISKANNLADEATRLQDKIKNISTVIR